MKKIISVILCLTMIFAFSVMGFADNENSSFGAYDHVFIIGVDGAGQYFNEADTPYFDAIFKDNAVTYTASAEYITTSAQNWGSILCGVAYDVHGFTNDSIESNQRDSSSVNPSVFRLVRQADENALLASFANWKPINTGIIENDLGVKKYTSVTDWEITEKICAYINSGNAPKLMYVQFDSVDHAGHNSNCNAWKFRNQIHKVDQYIGDVYYTLCENGLMDNGLFIVVADHGHSTEGGHGGQSIEETLVTVAVAGRTVKNTELSSTVKNRDVASIVLYALGIEQPANMTSVLPENLFGENKMTLNTVEKQNHFERLINRIKTFIEHIFTK